MLQSKAKAKSKSPKGKRGSKRKADTEEQKAVADFASPTKRHKATPRYLAIVTDIEGMSLIDLLVHVIVCVCCSFLNDFSIQARQLPSLLCMTLFSRTRRKTSNLI